METPAKLGEQHPQTQEQLILELETAIQRLKEGLSSHNITQHKIETIMDRLKGRVGLTHQVVGEVNLFSLMCSNHVIASWPDSTVRPAFEVYVNDTWASCTAPVSEHIASWGAMMGRLRRKFIAKLQALPKDDIFIDPVLKLTLVLCQYERVLHKSKPPGTQDRMDLLPNVFQQLAQTVARFYTVSDQLFGEIDQCMNQIAIPLLRQDGRTPQDYSKLVIYIAKTASACEHHANENSLRSAWQLTASMPELRSKWEMFRAQNQKKIEKQERRRRNKARLRMEQIEIAAHLLAPLGNKNTIKIEPLEEETKLSYDSELEEGEIDERVLSVKQEAHTELTYCVVERFVLPAGVSYHDKPVRMDATASALAIKVEPTAHTATGTKRRAEELEEGSIVVKKERLED